jgi:hypothetical protein
MATPDGDETNVVRTLETPQNKECQTCNLNVPNTFVMTVDLGQTRKFAAARKSAMRLD